MAKTPTSSSPSSSSSSSSSSSAQSNRLSSHPLSLSHRYHRPADRSSNRPDSLHSQAATPRSLILESLTRWSCRLEHGKSPIANTEARSSMTFAFALVCGVVDTTGTCWYRRLWSTQMDGGPLRAFSTDVWLSQWFDLDCVLISAASDWLELILCY